MITIGDHAFPSQKAVSDHLQSLFQRSPPEIDRGELFEFLSELLKRHHSYEEKLGDGIAAFRITKRKGYDVVIIHHDATTCDFSYKKCISGAPKSSAREDTIKAMRACASKKLLDKPLVSLMELFLETHGPCTVFGKWKSLDPAYESEWMGFLSAHTMH